MKKIISIVVILLLMLGLCACKTKKTDEDIVVGASESEGVKGADEQEKVTDEPKDTDGQKDNIKTDEPDAPASSEQLPEAPPSDNDAQIDESQETSSVGHQVIVDYLDVEYGTPEAVENFYGASDCFVGKILDSEQAVIDEEVYQEYFDPNFSDEYMDEHYFRLNADFTNVVYPLNAELYIYTVEVEKSIFSIFTEEGAKIKVIADVSDMTEEYKVGNRYIMKGTIFQYKEETMLNLKDEFRAKVDKGGSLIGLSRDAKLFETLKTVDELASNRSVQAAFKKRLDIPTNIYTAYGLPQQANIMHTDNKPILDSIIADGKKAILADSKFKMKIDTEAR